MLLKFVSILKTNNKQLVFVQKYKKGKIFEYSSHPTTIRKIEITGCKICLINDMTADNDNIIIDFTHSNDNLAKLEPCLQRTEYVDVDFIYEGFLVRIRPGLDEFLDECYEDFDIVIYTSANRVIYEGLLKVLHEFLIDQAGHEDDNAHYWNDILFREDCTLDVDGRGKPYHHKDLTLFGCDLSRVIMVDNSPIVCHGFEPNFILIKDFFGKSENDDDVEYTYVFIVSNPILFL